MLDDIYIDTPGVSNLAEQLNAAGRRLHEVTGALNDIKAQMTEVWQDEGFENFSVDYQKGMENLISLKAEIYTMEKILTQACDEYKLADDQVLALL